MLTQSRILKSTGLIFFVFAFLSLLLFTILIKLQDQSVKEIYNLAAEERVKTFEQQLVLDIDLVLSLGSLYAASSNVDRGEFKTFTTPLLEKEKSILGMLWIPHVSNADRLSYEQSVQQEGFKNLQITQLEENRTLKAASEKKYYLPISYVEPLDSFKDLMGLDVNTIAYLQEVFLGALQGRDVILSPQTTILTSKGEQDLVFAIFPIYKKNMQTSTLEQRQKNIEGFVAAIFEIEKVFEQALSSLSTQGLEIFIYEKGESGLKLLHEHYARNYAKGENIEIIEDSNWIYEYSLNLAHSEIYIKILPTKRFLESKKSIIPLVVLVVGLLITALLTFNYYQLVSSRSRIESEVLDRTRDLKAANQELSSQSAELADKVEQIEEQNEELEKTKLATLNILEDLEESKGALEKLNTDLEEQKEELDRSNAELEQFAYVASHDLKEPLRKIISFGDLLEEEYAEKLEGEGQEYLERMQNAAGRMKNLIDGLLDYSRVSTQAKPFVEVDLNKTVQEVLSNLEIRIQDNNGKVEVDPLPVIQADELQMFQLFQNVVGNGLKYKRDGVDSEIQVHAQNTNNGHVHIEITDNGVGFDQKYADQIFAPFRRLHGRTEFEGTGIGLSICQKIVLRHNGKISAKSEEGKGSTFMIDLPLNPKQNGETHDDE